MHGRFAYDFTQKQDILTPDEKYTSRDIGVEVAGI
jgi:hypothetical protein